jgi:hypothetical protein
MDDEPANELEKTFESFSGMTWDKIQRIAYPGILGEIGYKVRDFVRVQFSPDGCKYSESFVVRRDAARALLEKNNYIHEIRSPHLTFLFDSHKLH